MLASLFTAPLETITAGDVQAFLELDLEEGTRLDYKDADPKQGIPQKTLDVVVAFANTSGGLLILGVKADKITNRPVVREGLPLLNGLEERVTSQCYSSIIPAYLPEVRVCPFKSAQGLSEPDRAFVIIRVQPSLTVHSTKENRVLVRINSECRDANLTTLRFLFERERQREELTEQMGAELSQGRMNTVLKCSSDAPDERWTLAPYRTYIELVPLDAPVDILPFGSYLADIGSLDDHVMLKVRMGKSRWRIEDHVWLPRGLGMLVYFGALTVDPRPVSVLYVDKSGGALLDIAAKSLGFLHDPPPQYEQYSRRSAIAGRYCLLLGEFTDILWPLLREQGYTGRIRATVWSAMSEGQPPDVLKAYTHRGEMILHISDPWPELASKLVAMVSAMTRSWLGYTFGLRSWEQNGEPVFDE